MGFFTVFLESESFSQTIFESKIIDSSSKLPIPYATIKIINSNYGTYSDSLGKFKLNLKSILDTVIVSSLGYHSKTLIFNNQLAESKYILLSQNMEVLNEIYISNYVNKGAWSKPYHKAKSFCNTFLYAGTTLKMEVTNIKGKINGLRFNLIMPTSDMVISVRPVITDIKGKALLKKDYTKTFNLKFHKNRKIEFEFDEDVNIPNEGAFIGLETISVPNNNNYNKSVLLQCCTERGLMTEMTTLKNFTQQSGIAPNFDKIIDSGIYIEIKRPK